MEPITPFIERVRELYREYGISTVLVAGSSGSYFQIADQIVQMDKYVPKEITEFAKKAAADYPALKFPEESQKSHPMTGSTQKSGYSTERQSKIENNGA